MCDIPYTAVMVYTNVSNSFAEDEALKGRYDAPEEFGPIARGKDINGSFFSDYTIEDDDTPTYHGQSLAVLFPRLD